MYKRFSLLFAISGALAQASILNVGQTFVSPSFTPLNPNPPYAETVTQAGLIDLSGCGSGGFNSSGCAAVTVDYGLIKMHGDFTGSGNSISRGTWRDDLTFTSPNFPTGTLVMVTYSIGVNGDLGNPTPGGQSNWGLQADLGGGAFDINKFGHLNGVNGFTGDPFGVFSATVQIQLGFVAPLSVELSGSAQGAFGSNAPNPSASYDLSHTGYWAGIQSVTVNGQPIAFDVSSGSGTNYAQSFAAPEPSTGLLLAGAFAIGWIVKRRA